MKGGKKPLPRLVVAVSALGLFLVGYYWGNQYRHGDSTPPVIEGVLVRPPRPLPAFEFRDAAGRLFTTERFAGHWTLLSFGDSSRAPGQSVVMRMIEVYNRLAITPDLQEKLLLVLATRIEDSTPAWDSTTGPRYSRSWWEKPARCNLCGRPWACRWRKRP